MKKHLPFALTTLRLLLGPLALLCAFKDFSNLIFLPLLVVGTLSDIFDGILARRFGVSTAVLRRYDSIADVIYYLFILGALWVLRRDVVAHNWLAIALLLASEIAVITVSYIRFRRYPAAHSYLAKFYGFCLLAALIALLAFNASSWAIVALAAVALVTNMEILAIHALADAPPVDVHSIYSLLQRKTSDPV
jgi:CDP-diacylglycerol--glycerol-3-phosphate 3-phosphatidyltransferase